MQNQGSADVPVAIRKEIHMYCDEAEQLMKNGDFEGAVVRYTEFHD